MTIGLKEHRAKARTYAQEYGTFHFTKNGQKGLNQINFWTIGDCEIYINHVKALIKSQNELEQGEEKPIEVDYLIVEEETKELEAINAKAEKNKEKDNDSLADALANALRGKIVAGLDTKEVNRLIDAKLASVGKPLIIEVKQGDKVTKIEGLCHKEVPKLIKLANARQHTFLVGEAGSGKTTACMQVAEALSLSFEYTAFNSQSTKADLYGFIDANGIYRETSLYRMYTKGGVWLADELDSANANILTSINALLENSMASFPNGVVKKHKDFICFGAGNTYGKGKNRVYVGRNELDGASLDRFFVLTFDYDETLERQIANNDAWTRKVQAIRKAINELGERLICSPRASYKGAKLLAEGFKENELLDSLIFRGCNEETKQRILVKAGV